MDFNGEYALTDGFVATGRALCYNIELQIDQIDLEKEYHGVYQQSESCKS